MVTFALPGDTEAAPAVNGTPRARPPLPFANRANGGTPFSSRSSRQLGTPQATSSRKLLMTRDEMPASSLNRSSMAAARNIFRASSVADSPPPNNVPFSPMLPQSTMKKVFAPGATPEPSRVYRESTAHATPRGMAAKAVEKDLFPMRISSPPRELTGEVLAQKVPKEWNSKGSIYADQFLAHLCPPELDEEQRRQFFCILDLRRLKYAANEIFSKKDWKLNVVNFAKEFEKSRSIILLRYGLYEFQNVKPSKEVLKRWRREHGLPEPEEEDENIPTPTQPTVSKKRKADTDLSKTSAPTAIESTTGKRRATELPTEEPIAIPASSKVLGKNKRRASMDEDAETPNKQHKPAPSAAKSLFERIANKPATSTESPKPVSFNANKPAAGGLARSVFENLKTGASQPPSTTSDNIFGYLSDTNSARNSGVEADAESDYESDEEDEEEEEEEEESELTTKSASETSAPTPVLTNGTPTASAASLFAPKPPTPSEDDSSTPGTRESTPGRSIFDRVTKGNDGQPVRASDAESAAGKASPVADQTWNPATTPLKFAPTSAGSTASLFGKPAASTATSSIFGNAPSPATNLFGSNAEPSKETTSASESAKEGESDKENESRETKASAAAAEATPAAQSLFQLKPTTAAPAAAPATSLFGFASKPASTSMFGAASKPAETASAAASTLFGVKPSEPEKSGAATPVPTFSFGQKAEAASAPSTAATAPSSLFGAAPTTAKPLFGATPTAPKTDASAAATPTFSFGAGGSGISTTTSTAPKADAAPAPAPAFSFGAASGAPASKPLFGAPKSPEATSTASNMFGSPMKQDDQSPAKKMFTGSGNAGSAAPAFGFSGNASATPSAAPVFGGATSQPANSGVSFGSATTNPGNSFGFNFGAEPNGNSSFNNPFASGSNGANGATQSSAPAGGFSFAAGSTPSTTPNTSFQFGANPAQSGGSMFGGNTGGNTGGNSTPMFGGAPSSGAAPSFSFGAGSGQAPAGGNMFGSNQATPAFGNSLQPPVGGSSTAGTSKSQFAHRKIAPLKRRL